MKENKKTKCRKALYHHTKEDIIEYLIEAREQRDNYKDLCFKYKSMLESFETRINKMKAVKLKLYVELLDGTYGEAEYNNPEENKQKIKDWLKHWNIDLEDTTGRVYNPVTKKYYKIVSLPKRKITRAMINKLWSKE